MPSPSLTLYPSAATFPGQPDPIPPVPPDPPFIDDDQEIVAGPYGAELYRRLTPLAS